MNLLLDTHAFIWFMEGNLLLSKKSRSAIENPENNINISIVSLFEIAIKIKSSKIGFDKPVSEFFNDITEYNLSLLPISEKHLIAYDSIPLLSTHKDPFDRLIIATALVDKLSLISIDKQFDKYKEFIPIFW